MSDKLNVNNSATIDSSNTNFSLQDASISRPEATRPISDTNFQSDPFSSSSKEALSNHNVNFVSNPFRKNAQELRAERAIEEATSNTNISSTVQSLDKAREELLELATKNANLSHEEIDVMQINAIISRIQLEHTEIEYQKLNDLLNDFKEEHFKSRQNLLRENIKHLGQEHGNKFQLNTANGLNYEGELESLLVEYKDLFSTQTAIPTNTKAELVQIYENNFANESFRIKAQEEQKLLKHVEQIAVSQANRYFKEDPGIRISDEIITHQLKELMERYPGASPINAEARERLEQRVAKLYADSYNKAYEKEFQKLNWVQRNYYGAKSWMIDTTNGIKNFTKNAYETGTKIVNAGLAVGKVVGQVLDTVVDATVNIGKGTVNLITEIPGALYNAAKFGVSTAWSITKLPFQATIGIGKALYNFEYSKIPEMASNAWSGACTVASTCASLAGSAIGSAGSVIYSAGAGAISLAGMAIKKTAEFFSDPNNILKVIDTGLNAMIAVGKTVRAGFKNTVDFLSSPEKMLNAFVKTCDAVISIGTPIRKALGEIGSFLTNPERMMDAFITIGTPIRAALVTVGTAIINPNNWIKTIELAGKSIEGSINFTAKVLRDPKGAYNDVVNTYNKVKDAVAPYIAPIASFLHEVGADMGINDILYGARSLIQMPFELAYNTGQTLTNLVKNMRSVINGEMTPDQYAENFKQDLSKLGRNLKENLKNSTLLVTGSIKFGLEVTGIRDIYEMTKALIKGDLPSAAMYAIFAGGTIWAAATAVYTGGASIAAMQGYKSAVKTAIKKTIKEGTELLGKDLGKETLQSVYRNLGNEVAKKGVKGEALEQAGKEFFETQTQKTALEIADRGILELNEKVQKEGISALNEDTVENLIEGISEELGGELYEKLGITATCKKTALEFLERTSKMSERQIRKELKDLGMSRKLAKKTAKRYKNALKNGNYDDALKDQLTDLIEDGLKGHIEQNVKIFTDRFRKLLLDQTDEISGTTSQELKKASQQLREALETKAKKEGKEVTQLADELTEAAERGYKNGMERALTKAVREGVESAIKKFRTSKKRIRTESESSENETSFKATKLESTNSEVSSTTISARDESDKIFVDKVGTRFEYVVIEGKIYRQKFELAFDDETWNLVNASLIGSVDDTNSLAKENNPLSLRGKK